MSLSFKAAYKEQQKNIQVDYTRDNLLTNFSKDVLKDRYLLPGELYQDLFLRVAKEFSDDVDHGQRIYNYMSKLWFLPATPILCNSGSDRGLPISCYLNQVQDSLVGINEVLNENFWLSASGGGIGTDWSNIRSVGEKVGENGKKSSGVLPFINASDGLSGAISQGCLRRGAAAVYMRVDHPEIEEFLDIRKPTGGDPNRKVRLLHHGIIIPDSFMDAVKDDTPWELRSPATNQVIRRLSARELWMKILTTRLETGEPYIIYIDNVNKMIPEHHKKSGLTVKMSNLCSEITLPTGTDYLGNDRTAVCCLSSVNVENFDEWKNDKYFVEDIMRFLDNILTYYINNAPSTMAKAKYSAMRERSVGLGVMGFHSFLQKKMVPFESVVAQSWNKKIFQHLRHYADLASKKLAEERGACPDAADYGVQERFSNKLAIAPTASISIIAGTSPSIEPGYNSYTHKTLSGSTPVKNKFLEKLLESKGYNLPEVWSSINMNQGSVQHLPFLSDYEKLTFKTPFEIDQKWVVLHAAERTQYICQSQSLNLFLPATVDKKDLLQIHYQAWKKGIKSMYYVRSLSIQRAEGTRVDLSHLHPATNPANNNIPAPVIASNNYEECVSCQ